MFGDYVTKNLKISIMVYSQRKKSPRIWTQSPVTRISTGIHLSSFQVYGLSKKDTTQIPVNRGDGEAHVPQKTATQSCN